MEIDMNATQLLGPFYFSKLGNYATLTGKTLLTSTVDGDTTLSDVTAQTLDQITAQIYAIIAAAGGI